MDYITLAQLILEFGVPFAEKMWQIGEKWAAGTPPTQADFDALKALSTQSALNRMQQNLVKAGVPLNSEQAKALLALTA